MIHILKIGLTWLIKKRAAEDHQKQLHQLEQILTARRNQIGQAQRDAIEIEKVINPFLV